MIKIHIETEEEQEGALRELLAAAAADKARREQASGPARAAVAALANAIAMGSGQGSRIEEVVWSLWNGSNKVGLCDALCGLDGNLQEALLAVIRHRMAAGGDADDVLRAILDISGAMKARVSAGGDGDE